MIDELNINGLHVGSFISSIRPTGTAIRHIRDRSSTFVEASPLDLEYKRTPLVATFSV
ncbi:hypothetical protein PGT21_020682 [Puccinia graminis f. sp. tritici]|uniref:Uncharacterized protein n=1 Tax=Puccinia graminis f. sp. tritici TaxID=56615 RepID=A0A5B0LXZ5_PUCGR|nr:hypothetical protein PGT21_020682 [Puccinia graminis f. sp. tritici]